MSLVECIINEHTMTLNIKNNLTYLAHSFILLLHFKNNNKLFNTFYQNKIKYISVLFIYIDVVYSLFSKNFLYFVYEK